MQTPLLGATALTLVAAVNLSSARAEGPKLSGDDSWPGISQRADHGNSPVPASGSMLGPRVNGRNVAPGILDFPVDPAEAAIMPHCEWQYHYAGRHAHWEEHRVLVAAPIQSAARAATVANQSSLLPQPREATGPATC
jgi:hypothetical protein